VDAGIDKQDLLSLANSVSSALIVRIDIETIGCLHREHDLTTIDDPEGNVRLSILGRQLPFTMTMPSGPIASRTRVREKFFQITIKSGRA
jgi:hypothetical protein